MNSEITSTEVTTRVAKDRISSIVERAEHGRRTTVLSRSVPIAIIGPPSDIEENEKYETISTTEIKTGQRSIKGMVARGHPVLISVRGRAVASLRRTSSQKQKSSRAYLNELLDLLKETQVIQNEAAKYRRIREYTGGLVQHCEAALKYLPLDHSRDELAATLAVLKSDLDRNP